MVLWFVGMAVAACWLVFSDRALDWRAVGMGALAPDAVDLIVGGGNVSIGHTLTASALLLGVVMAATRGRRHARRRLLALPMGTFLHLVFDGAWASTTVFWWPAFGTSFPDQRLFSLERPAVVIVAQEVIGLMALVWAVRRFRAPAPSA